ncbi:MAG: site-specific integrase [Nostoc sp.]|uniref:tyrosine-type recombinase/integrase n=1 Tax=Nostoc sp. TaxID=1180 RepID=UPI002FF71E85
MTHGIAHSIGGNSYTMVHTVYKGQVNVEICGKSYRIRFTHHGQRKCFGTGIKSVDKSSENAVVAIAKQMESDLYRGTFDDTLERYKPERYQKPELTLIEQFQRFMLTKQSEVRPYTFKARFEQHRVWTLETLKQFRVIEDATTNGCAYELSVLQRTLKTSSIRCKIVPIMLFWDWMQADADIPVNPWRKALKRLKPDEIEKPEPFSANEREQILNTMSFNNTLKPWEPITRFLMSTGCRPSEAFALTYGDINQLDGYLTISKSAVDTHIGKTKTGKVRRIPLNENIRIALEAAVQGRDMYNQSLCFPHPRTGEILTSKLYASHWKLALKLACVPYRKPYSNRHTFATEALLQGGNPVEVAKILGNSPKVIYQHYLNVTGDTSKSMPEI